MHTVRRAYKSTFVKVNNASSIFVEITKKALCGMTGVDEKAETEEKQYGVSRPLSTTLPTETDIRLTNALSEVLVSYNLYETDLEMEGRIAVLRRLNTLIKQWVRSVAENKNLSPDLCQSVGGKLFTFGSYRLGVHNRGADIDSLCVAPRHVDRNDFFTSFYEMLSKEPDVTDLHGVEDAFVPLIKMKMCNIEIDMLFARLALTTVPDDQSLSDDTLLKNLDEKCIRSLNGCRVADEILRAVPNVKSFILVLRSIKLWAKVRGVYSNILGFFGGITWAILVARICQLYPNASASKLLYKFFFVFSTWTWPHPVILKELRGPSSGGDSYMSDWVWDPRTKSSDRFNLMPVITPAFPEQNSTFNVTKSTKTVLTNELNEALEICHNVFNGKANWKQLFEEVNFFTRYKHFICVACAAKTSADHLIYEGFVESKLRHLISYLDRHQGINVAHINPKEYSPCENNRVEIAKDAVCTLWFIGLDIDAQLAKQMDLTGEIAQFVNFLESAKANAPGAKEGRSRYNSDMKIDVSYVRQKFLKYYISRDDMLRGVRYKPTVKKEAVKRRMSTDSTSNTSVNNEADSSLTSITENEEPESKQLRLSPAASLDCVADSQPTIEEATLLVSSATATPTEVQQQPLLTTAAM